MKTLSLLALLVAGTLIMGCSSDPCGCCGELKANCCGWEFYKPCDLIEGRRACCDRDLCDEPVVVESETIEIREIPAPEAPSEAPDAADAPAAAASEEGPVADFGLPPNVR